MAIIAHDTIGDDIILLGRYEADLLSAITDTIVPMALPEHRNFIALDVGANIGNHALVFAQHFSRVFAFEPNPVTVHLLRANILLNRAANISVCPVGLGASDHSALFRIERGNLGASRFISESDQSSSDPLNLQIVNGDSYLRDHLTPSDRVGLVKIDVEGFEDFVVVGLAETLKKDSPLVFFEASDRAAAEKTAAALRAIGYRHFVSIEPSPVPSKPEILRAAVRWFVGSHLHLQQVESFEDRPYGLILSCASIAWIPPK